MAKYDAGLAIRDLFLCGVLGFQTHRDRFAISETKTEIASRLNDMADDFLTDDEFHRKHGTKDNRDWSLAKQRQLARTGADSETTITKCLYRPFDVRWCDLSYRMMDYPRTEIVQNVLNKENLCLLAPRQLAKAGYQHILVTDLPAESCAISLTTKEQNQVLPLYLYPDEQDRRVNFDPKLWKQLQAKATHPTHGIPDEMQTFDYIYGVLHCPAYRDTYAEFLKIDFPRIPWPATPDAFWDIAEKGNVLRKLHLMDPAAVGKAPYPFKGEGDGMVDKPELKDGHVWINETQYFADIPPVSWEFYIGGYQPAQKWLKDRKGRALSFDDVRHYQSILKILSETDRIMQTIEMTFEA